MFDRLSCLPVFTGCTCGTRRWRRARRWSKCCAQSLRLMEQCQWVRPIPADGSKRVCCVQNGHHAATSIHAVTRRRARRAGSRELGFRAPGALSDAAALLAASGARLAARHDFRSAFAAWLAERAARWDLPPLDGMRRYEVGSHFAACAKRVARAAVKHRGPQRTYAKRWKGPADGMASRSPGCVHKCLSCSRPG